MAQNNSGANIIILAMSKSEQKSSR